LENNEGRRPPSGIATESTECRSDPIRFEPNRFEPSTETERDRAFSRIILQAIQRVVGHALERAHLREIGSTRHIRGKLAP